ncbi:hypothetical protein BJX61DRAFT_540040 [Aspergillus egyptiacus]|nr:hypothetical protein BJX61DRAFT_540040 [Aspergillus egyptiacus]
MAVLNIPAKLSSEQIPSSNQQANKPNLPKTVQAPTMPKGPINSPPLHPKKVHGVVDDDAPLDDYEDAVHEREQQEHENQHHRLADEPNIAAARRANRPPVPNAKEGKHPHTGATGSKNRSK